MTAATPLLGSGFNPSVWCVNPGCHAPVPANAGLCPDCGHIQQPELARRALALFETFTALKPRHFAAATDGDLNTAVRLMFALEKLELVVLDGSRFVRTSKRAGGVL